MTNFLSLLGRPSEKLRQQLITEELKLRKKQPEHWAKTKYRKYAKPFTEEELVTIKELGKKRDEVLKMQRKKAKKKGKSQGKSKFTFRRKKLSEKKKKLAGNKKTSKKK